MKTPLSIFMTIVAMSSAAEAILGALDRDGQVGLQNFFLLADNFGKRGDPDAAGTLFTTVTVYDTVKIIHPAVTEYSTREEECR